MANKALALAIAGADGRMGQALITAIAEDASCQYTQAIVRATNLASVTKAADVLLDFSVADALPQHLAWCVSERLPIVVGITGLTSALQAELAVAAQQIPVLYAANTSIGVQVCSRLLATCSQLLGPEWQVCIQDLHHQHKKDAPSGTSLQLAKQLDPSKHVPQLHSIRMADLPGEHQIMFVRPGGEQLVIRHTVLNRSVFAAGALVAAKWLAVAGRPAGLYGMQDVLA